MTRQHFNAILVLALLATLPAPARAAEQSLGDFDAQADVGKVEPPGSATFAKEKRQYQLTAAGDNIWGTHDDFHFLYRKATADFVLTATVAFQGEGKNAHRKTGLMLRQNLEPGAPYADIVVHGDGLISLQYREAPGGATKEIKSQLKSTTATIRLERKGETITASVAGASLDKPAADKPHADKPNTDKPAPVFDTVGSVKLPLNNPAYLGLVVCSHDPAVRETAIHSNVNLTTQP